VGGLCRSRPVQDARRREIGPAVFAELGSGPILFSTGRTRNHDRFPNSTPVAQSFRHENHQFS
jgi:hypothetical protein